jgi:hypothetical protein
MNEKASPLAITAMALGIGSLAVWIFLGMSGQMSLALATLPLSIAAVLTGHVAIRQIKRGAAHGRGFARTGLIAGYLSVSLLILLYVVVIYALWVWGNGGKGLF